ncbi:uncharacterized protein TNCV_1162991 [Trichonephila clavipes]|nr:uncharacterized protein TNCV_1162991 [Trichonephila clavipes]
MKGIRKLNRSVSVSSTSHGILSLYYAKNKKRPLKSRRSLFYILVENSLKSNVVNLSDFSQLQLKNSLEQYFHEKLNCGRQLGVSPQLILEGLTVGMPTNIKQLMTINPPTSPTEWLME